MNKTKYFVIPCDVEDAYVRYAANTLNEAREEAERYAMEHPGVRFLIAAEVQSVVVETQAKWTVQ